MLEVADIKTRLQESLSEYRFNHSLRVAEESKKLAKIYGVDENKAYLTGLVHDIAKEFSNEENLEWIKKANLSGDLLNSEFKRAIHSEIGAIVIEKIYGFEKDIVDAVRYHTLGNKKMDMLAKIIFVADKIEPGKNYPGIEEERKTAYQDINKALYLCLKNQKEKHDAIGKSVHPDSLELLDYLEKNNCFLSRK